VATRCGATPQLAPGDLAARHLDERAQLSGGGPARSRGAKLITPGNPSRSVLLARITSNDPDLRMPPKQKLTGKEMATLTEWVTAGAIWPEPAAVLIEDDPSKGK